MKIRLAFIHSSGKIRARIYGDHFRILTVGNYYREGNGDWTARLRAAPDDPHDLIPDGVITAPDVLRLSNAAAARGKWWA